MDINGTDQNDKLGGAKNGSSFREIERINLITGIGSDKINLSAANYGWHWGTNVAAGEGNDSLLGGTGDDVYIINEQGDKITEKDTEGLDRFFLGGE